MGIKIISENRKAFYNYQILERFEAGIVLKGSEVKSLRAGKLSLGDAYAMLQGGEIFLFNAHISAYQASHYADHNPLRTRKLLLHQREINKLIGSVQEKGLTLVPLKVYFKEGRAKMELALAKSKKVHDKRESIQKRETDRHLRRVLSSQS